MSMLWILSFATLAVSATFDYIVVGGGTCGLVVSNRLSEQSGVSVLVIEAGGSVLNNPAVYDPTKYGVALKSAIDYQYQTVPQTNGANRKQTLSAGKAIGGTSTINGMSFTRAESLQIDAWEKLGNTGWNWKSLWPYYLKSEHFQPPTQSQISGGASFNPSYHGSTGPLKVGFSPDEMISPLPSSLNQTYINLGIPYSPDVSGGRMRGFNVYPKTIDESTGYRHDASRAYYWPITSRKNLQLMANTTVNRILWGTDNSGLAVASGVEVSFVNGTRQNITAAKEVIVSAGALSSPVLLERSGVGNPNILSKAGVPTKVSLAGVGENLIDQINNGATYKRTGGGTWTGSGAFLSYPNITDLLGPKNASSLASSVLSALPSYASAVAAQNNGASTAAQLQTMMKIQWDLLFTSQIPAAEIIIYQGSSTSLGSEYWGTLPFARGNIHITASSSSTPPTINPNYFLADYDLKTQIALGRFMRRFYSTSPINQYAATESWPGTTTVPTTASDSVWTNWLKGNFRGNYHVLGSVSMMPRDKGGAVDSRLKVYGTKNVRVIDGSIFPFQVCGHLMSTLYAVAERASDMIKEDNA